MASALYGLGRALFGNAGISWTADNIKVALVMTGGGHYVVSIDADQYLSAISGGDIVSTTANLSGKSNTLGVMNAANTTFAAVSAGPAAGALVIYKDSGSSATSPLIAYIDDYAGLPVTPNGNDINVSWPTSANKIYKL